MTYEPLPLPTHYNLDLEPVPRAEPGAATFEQVESLYLKWMLAKPTTLTCHAAVVASIMRGPQPEPVYPPREVRALYGIAVVVDDTMDPGAWKLMAGDDELDSGVIRA